MLRQLFKSLVVARQASAAIEALRFMSDRDLEDIGFTRATYVEQIKVQSDEIMRNTPYSQQLLATADVVVIVTNHTNTIIAVDRQVQLLEQGFGSHRMRDPVAL